MAVHELFDPQMLPTPNKYGFFTHPHLPEDPRAWKEFFNVNGYKAVLVTMEDDDPDRHDTYMRGRYHGDFSAAKGWTPEPPEVNEWQIALRWDSEKGPLVIFVQPIAHWFRNNKVSARLSNLAKLRESTGPTHTFWRVANEAMKNANGNPGEVDWREVEHTVIQESIGENGQSPEVVRNALWHNSPECVSEGQKEAIWNRIRAKEQLLQAQYEQRHKK